MVFSPGIFCAFPVLENEPRTLERFTGYLQYESWFEQQKSKEKNKGSAPTGKTAGGKSAKISFKEKFELDNMEALIKDKEQLLTTLQEQLQDPKVISNSTQLVELSTQISSLQTELEKTYARWAELEAKSGN